MFHGKQYKKYHEYEKVAGSEHNPYLNPPHLTFSELVDHVREWVHTYTCISALVLQR